MKKLLSLMLAVISLLSLCSCTSRARPDINLFADRMAQIDFRYRFDYFDMFIYDENYHVYLNLCEENDAMLSFKIDELGNIDLLTITAYYSSVKTDEARTALKDLFVAAIDSFAELDKKETEEKDAALSYQDTDKYFTDLFETYSTDRYNFTFSSNKTYMCLSCEYYEPMTDTQK